MMDPAERDALEQRIRAHCDAGEYERAATLLVGAEPGVLAMMLEARDESGEVLSEDEIHDELRRAGNEIALVSPGGTSRCGQPAAWAVDEPRGGADPRDVVRRLKAEVSER